MRKGPQMGTCFESRTQESLLAFACHFRKSSATLEDALAFPEIQCFEGFEPRTLRLLLFLRNSSDFGAADLSCYQNRLSLFGGGGGSSRSGRDSGIWRIQGCLERHISVGKKDTSGDFWIS